MLILSFNSIPEIVRKVEILLSNLISESNAKVIVDKELPRVSGHQGLITQLFQNIIKNAINHNNTENDTIIKISSARKDKDMLSVSIADNSGGIPDYIIPTLFDLFASSDKNKGSGIGLATCKKIVTHYGGEICVDVEEGVGSTFNFTFPYLSPE